MKKIILLLLMAAFFNSCMQKGYVLYDKKPDETITTKNLKSYMSNNPNPTIVVRAPNSSNMMTEQDQNGQLYNIIENELLKAGFNIKDRTLFNQVIENNRTLSYQEIYDLTKTDLILELTNINNRMRYNTNVYYTNKNETKVSGKNITRSGASIEFKILYLKENRLMGSYIFNYSPCTTNNNDCQCAVGYKSGNRLYPYENYCVNTGYTAYQNVEQDVLNNIVKYGIEKFIEEIK